MSAAVETPSVAWAAWEALTEDEKRAMFDYCLGFDNEIPGLYLELTAAEKKAWLGQAPVAYLLHLTGMIAREVQRRLEGVPAE